MSITCDRCNRKMQDDWTLDTNKELYGGVCENCEDTICGECAGVWIEGVCLKCANEIVTKYMNGEFIEP